MRCRLAVFLGAFGLFVVQRAADGNVVARSTPDPSNATDRVLGQIVYAGVKPPSAASTGLSPIMLASIALVGIGVVLGGVLGFRAWRNRGLDENGEDNEDEESEIEREAELRARLERFKKRTPDPRPPE